MKSRAGAKLLLWPLRYELLDGLRGMAALVVVLTHLNVVSNVVGHAAVMVFFVISGYCITASADSFRHNGRRFAEFMGRRLRRIYPPYLFALAFFAVTRLIKAAMGAPNVLHRPAIDWVQNLTMTQWVSDLFHPVAEPVQNPKLFVAAFWSLNYEEQFYLVMAIALVLATRRRLPLIVSVACLGIAGLAWNWSIAGGWICGLFLEYWVHFAMGSGLFFALTQFDDRWRRNAFVLLTALVGAASAARIALSTTGDPNYFLRAMTELAFLSAVTLFLYFSRPLNARICQSWLWRPFAALGTISYSLYLIHQFNLTLVSVVARHIIPAELPHLLFVITELLLFFALATLFWWVCERPFMRMKPPPDKTVPAGAAQPPPARSQGPPSARYTSR